MKKMFRTAFLCCLSAMLMYGLNSCSSNEQVAPEEKLEMVEVNFNVSAFEQEVIPMGRIGQSTNDKFITRYGLYIYNDEGKLVKREYEENIAKNRIENLKYMLPQGNYTAILVAFNTVSYSEYDDLTNSDFAAAQVTSFYYHTIPFVTFDSSSPSMIAYLFHQANDVFYTKKEFYANKNAVVNMVGKRITARLELNITDIVKTEHDSSHDFAYVRIGLGNMASGIYFKDGTPTQDYFKEIYLTKSEWESYADKPLVFNSRLSQKGDAYLVFTFSDSWANGVEPLGSTDHQAVVNWKDLDIKYQKTISFNLYENKITRLTGPMFDESSFNVSIDNEYAEIIEGEI